MPYFQWHCRSGKIYPISVLVTSLFVTLTHFDWMPPCREAMPLEVWSELNSYVFNKTPVAYQWSLPKKILPSISRLPVRIASHPPNRSSHRQAVFMLNRQFLMLVNSCLKFFGIYVKIFQLPLRCPRKWWKRLPKWWKIIEFRCASVPVTLAWMCLLSCIICGK